MAQRGHTVAVLVLRPRLAEEWPADFNVVHLDMHKTPLSLLMGLARARRFLLDFRPDLLHSHSFHANFVARLLKPFLPSAKIVSTVHNVYEGGWPRMMAYRLTDPLAWRTTAVSQAAADRFVRLKAIPQDKYMVLTNGIDVQEFAPSLERRARMRTQMAAKDNFIWLAVGRIVPAKDYPNLLRAFAQVRAFAAQLWIAGSEASAEDAADLRALGAELGLGDSVRWLGLRRDMSAVLDASDGFVLSSAWEGMPLVVGEAMAMEKPVVATDAGGVRDLMGEAGFVVPVGDQDALAQAMLQQMRCTREEQLALGRAARQRIEKHFSIDARADDWETLYRTSLEPES
jgi:glycosyltransferase involved in cell wall biosynthesis